MAAHVLGEEECCVYHFSGESCRRCKVCLEWVQPVDASNECGGRQPPTTPEEFSQALADWVAKWRK